MSRPGRPSCGANETTSVGLKMFNYTDFSVNGNRIQ